MGSSWKGTGAAGPSSSEVLRSYKDPVKSRVEDDVLARELWLHQRGL